MGGRFIRRAPRHEEPTGGVISFGTGGVVCKSGKQKLVTKSSTEAETVGASDYLPNTLWVKMFLEAQGHNVHESFFEQDNESAIRLERNGRVSAGPKSRHIDIRYFWIKDRSKEASITIRHCPTLAMLADFFTKPLQGQLFHKFRAVLMGHVHVNTLAASAMTPVEERVGGIRSSYHGNVATGVIGTGAIGTGSVGTGAIGTGPVSDSDTGHNNMETNARTVPVTWTDVVRRPATVRTTSRGVDRTASGFKGQDLPKQSCFVSRSFSRNNPVNGVKV